MEIFLIPIDFSEVSVNAFNYGLYLASQVGAETKVLHVYFPTSQEIAESSVIDVDFEQVRFNYLEEFVDKKVTASDVDSSEPILIDKEFRVGYPTKEILQSAKENDAELIIMGTTGDSSQIKKWFGSVSTSIINDSIVPVLLVPQNAKYTGIHHIMFSFDNITLDLKILEHLVNFASTFNASIHLVHIKENGNNDPGFYLEEQLKEKYPLNEIVLTSLYHNDTVTALSEYAEKNKIDVLVMATQHRSFFNRIFHKSVTKEMSMHTDIPLLVLR